MLEKVGNLYKNMLIAASYISIIVIIFFLIYFFFYTTKKQKKTNNNVIPKKENFIVKNNDYNVKSLNSPFSCIFNIDEQCKNPILNKHLQWKCSYRNNQSEFNISKDYSFKDTPFTNYLDNTKLKYDDIIKI